jgi:hypothetical protein
MKTYSSPTEVFDASRQAVRSGDWRGFYFQCTPEIQCDLVFEAVFTCGIKNDPTLNAIQKKFGPAETAFEKRYWEEFKRKHGHAELIDKFFTKAIPYWELKDKRAGGTETGQAGMVPPPPKSAAMKALPKDEELLRLALYDVTKDKVAFFAEARKFIGKDRKPNIIGDLKQVTIKGDTATGRAKVTILPQPGDSLQKVRKTDKTFKFRRVNGSWLLDSL